MPRNKMRLEYVQTRTTSQNMPSLVINKEYADEFVKEYNSRNSDLNKLACTLVAIGALAGYRCCSTMVSKLIRGIPLGAGTGFLTASGISYNANNKLMDKYGVVCEVVKEDTKILRH